MPRVDYFDDPSAPPANSLVVAVTVLVYDDLGRVLLIRRSDNALWAPPGGGQEIGETVREAGVREVREETGLSVEIIGLVGIFSDPGHVIAYDDGEVRQEFAICLRGRALGGSAAAGDETLGLRWAAESEVDDLPMHKSVRARVRLGFNEDATAYVS